MAALAALPLLPLYKWSLGLLWLFNEFRGKLVPLRKMKLLQKLMIKEKHKSLPARAWTTNVLTHPAASSLHAQADIWEQFCPFPQESAPHLPYSGWGGPWLGASLVQGRLLQLELHGSDQTAPTQLWVPASNGRKEFQFRLPISLFFPLIIKVTFSLPSVRFFEDAIEDLSTALFPVENRAKRLPASPSRTRRN